MSLELFAHPFSSYSQKVLVALWENDTAFTYRQLGPADPGAQAELASRWPMARFPVLVDDGRTIVEATTIIEHLAVHHPGAVALIPAAADRAVEVRMLDRVFDNYVMTPVQGLVLDVRRDEKDRDPLGTSQARAMLDTAYAWLDARMDGRTWAVDDTFSLADCAAAPALFYADWTHPIDPRHAHLHAYRRRLLARPTIARAVDEGRPFRPWFPPGAPDRD